MGKRIIARTQSDDPAQEHLREHKSQWNSAVSSFIEESRPTRRVDRLIELKRLMNGKPAPMLGVSERTDIKEPIPDVATQTINQLVNEYQSMVQQFARLMDEGKNIIQEQSQYSQTRRQPMTPEQRQQMLQQMQQQQETPVVASHDIDIIKEGANPLTRLWTYIKTPFMFGDQDRFARKKMLQAGAELQTRLREINNAVLSGEQDAIPRAVLLTKDVVHLFDIGLNQPLIALNQIKMQNEITEKEQGEGESEAPKNLNYKSYRTLPLNEQTFEQYIKPFNQIKEFDLFRNKYPEVVGVTLGQAEDDKWYVVGTENRQEKLQEQKEEARQPTSKLEEKIEEINNPPSPIPSEADYIGDQVSDLDQIANWKDHVNLMHSEVETVLKPSFEQARHARGLPRGGVGDIEGAIEDFETSLVEFESAVDNAMDAQSIGSYYEEIIRSYSLIKSYEENIKAAMSFTDGQIRKMAQGRVSRWFRRKWIELLKRRGYHLQLAADEALKAADKSLNNMMDILQIRNAPLDEMTKATIGVAAHIGEVVKYLEKLADTHNNATRIDELRARSEGRRVVSNYVRRTDIVEMNRLVKDLHALNRFIKEEKEKKGEGEAGRSTSG